MSQLQASINAPPTLLVIGIHREELAFGLAVAEMLDPARVAILTVPEGISGKHPLADQHFRYEALHHALYLQLLPHVKGRYQLLIDLHTGSDPLGPSADLICADAALCARLKAAVRDNVRMATQDIRVIPLGIDTAFPHAHTVIPRQIWENPDFRYVGMEIYLPEVAEEEKAARKFAQELVGITASCVTVGH